MIRVLLADDHPLIRTGLRTSLEEDEELIVVGEARDGTDVLGLCQELSPDVLLLDLSMPGPSPAITVNAVMEQCPQVKIIVLTAYDDEVYIRKLVGLGVAGFILKDEAPETLVRAIHAALEGDTWFSRRVIDILATPATGSADIENDYHLTERESEVLDLLVKGRSNSQISEALVIVEGTVKNHLVNIYQKLGVHSRAEAISWVLHHEDN